MRPIDVFDAAFQRTEHVLTLYDLLHDTRARKVRRDWGDKFKDLMHWPSGENIVRIDGKNRDSIIILRESVGIDRTHFTHDYMSQLLGFALVAVVSALDRYLHDLVVDHCWKLLSRKEAEIPNELKKIQISITETKKAIKRLRSDKNSRPGYIVKKAIQKQLHKEFTFQKPDSVLQACKMLGIEDFWRSVSQQMPGNPESEDIISALRRIVGRRNQIVHEADINLKIKAKILTLRPLTLGDTIQWVNFVRDLAYAIDKVVQQCV